MIFEAFFFDAACLLSDIVMLHFGGL